MAPIPVVALRQFGVFTTDQALRAGWTPSALKHAVRVGRLIRVRTGVYALRPESTGDPFADRTAELRRKAAAVALTNGRVPVSHGAATLLHGLALSRIPERVCVTYLRAPAIASRRPRR